MRQTQVVRRTARRPIFSPPRPKMLVIARVKIAVEEMHTIIKNVRGIFLPTLKAESKSESKHMKPPIEQIGNSAFLRAAVISGTPIFNKLF